MAKVCILTGKKPKSGNNVSHSVRRTKRRFLPNLQRITLQGVDKNGRTVRAKMRISTAALRTLAKAPSKRELKQAERRAAKKAA